MEKQRKKFKITLIFMICIISCFFIAGIVQTFVLKAKQNTLENTKANTNSIEQKYNDTYEKYEYMSENPDDEDSDPSSQAYEDYWRQEGYGNEDDKQIDIEEP